MPELVLMLGLLVVMTLLGATAALVLKRAVGGDGLLAIVKSPFLWVGGGLYLAAAVLNIVVLRFLDLSVVLPLTSITYLWTLLLGVRVLKEDVRPSQWAGVALIVVGAALVAWS